MTYPGFVVVGAGGMGREAACVALQTQERDGFNFLGCLDDSARNEALLEAIGSPYLGPITNAASLPQGTLFVVAIADHDTRCRIDKQFCEWGLVPGVLIAENATIQPGASVEVGSILLPGARVGANATIKRHSHINLNASIAHDAVVGEFSSISPLVSLTGAVTLGSDVMVGSSACINPGVTVGDRAYIASGAAVTQDVPEWTLVAGVPAKVKKSLR